MVEQMVCKRDKAHCSPIRRRFLTLIIAAALLLTTAEAQTERVPSVGDTRSRERKRWRARAHLMAVSFSDNERL